jgi:hypothetical protein
MKACLFVIAMWLALVPASAQTTWGVDFYVATSGSDVNDCATPAEACATLHVAAARAAALGPQTGGVQYIHFGAGFYNEGANFNANTNLVSVLGAGSSATFLNNLPGGCGTIIANTGANIALSGMKISGIADPCTNTIYAQLGGVINIGNDIILGPAYGAQLHCEGPGSQVQIWGHPVAMGGGANNFASAVSGCQVGFNPVSGIGMTFNPTQSYPGGLFLVMVGASVYVPHNMTWVGLVSGIAYNANTNGAVWTDGNGCASLPASLPGVTSSGGICQ